MKKARTDEPDQEPLKKQFTTFADLEGKAAVKAVVESKTAEPGFFAGLKASFYRTFIHEERWKMVLDGLWITFYISVFSGIFGILLGFAICMVRRSKKAPLSVSSACFIRCV